MTQPTQELDYWGLELLRYLGSCGPLGWFQFVLLLLIFHRLVLRSLQWRSATGSPQGPWNDPAMQALTQACFALGLLLTFSGLYGYMAAGDTGGDVNLLKALGSSAIGYSAAALGAIASLIDAFSSLPRSDRIDARDLDEHPIDTSNSKEPFHAFPFVLDAFDSGSRPLGSLVDAAVKTDETFADDRAGGEPFDEFVYDPADLSASRSLDHDILDGLGEMDSDE